MANRLQGLVADLVRHLNARLDRWWATRMVRDAVLGFVAHDVLQHAGAMAYFSVLSLVNLLILGVVVISFLVGQGAARQLVVDRAIQALPVDAADVGAFIDRAIQARGGVTVIGLALLLWSALGIFSAVSAGIGKVFSGEPRAPFWRERLVGVILLALTGLLVAVSVGLGLGTQAIEQAITAQLQVPGLAGALAVISFLLSLGVVFVAFLAVYRMVPTERVTLADAATGALVASLAWTALRLGFTFFATKVARYDTLFGPIGAALGVLVFLYFSSVVLLLGAEVARASRDEDLRAPRAGLGRRTNAPDRAETPG